VTLLQLFDGKKAYGAHEIFSSASFSVNEGEHIGVIGPNGAGKTTLFKILVGEEELDGGRLTTSNALSLGYLSQHDHWTPEETGNSYLQRVSKLPLWEVKSMGRDLQVSEEMFAKPITSLSGGYRMRIKLIGLLGSSPNLMLLDEPTNYLDLETTLLLERFLQNYRGAFLLISHDREFLRRTTDHILEVETGELTKYNGNIDDYFEQKELLKRQLEARAQNQAEKRRALLEFITRFGAKATKARQAQSRMKTLQKMETIEMKAVPVVASIKIPAPPPVGKSVVKISQADFGYGERVILKNVNLEIRRGEHVAVVGLNGQGKSTLLKGLSGSLPANPGARELGYQVELAIFNQHVIEVLNPEHTVYESLEDAARSTSAQDIRNMAGSLLFSSDHIQKRIRVLSGGEKSRVALGRILLQRVPFLLLDEPTNHLDFQTVEALTQALHNYEGTLVVVSHDRGFIRRVATQILEVSNGQVQQYPGTYDEYVWSMQRSLAEEPEPIVTAKIEVKKDRVDVKPGQMKKELERKLRALDRKIQICEENLTKLEIENADLNDKIAAGHPSSDECVKKLSENALLVWKLEEEWIGLGNERELLVGE
jgi:ATP-binding cassette, subfamily F, member 3